MARLEIVSKKVKTPADQVSAAFDNDDLEINETAAQATASGGNYFKAAAQNILILRNSGSTGRLCTIISTRKGGRSGDIAVTIAAGKSQVIKLPAEGFAQKSGATAGCIHIDCAHAEIMVQAIQL